MSYDLADPVPLTVETRDAVTGALADATSVALVVTHVGSSTTFTLTPDHPSTGRYQYDFYPSLNGNLTGRYKVRWVATGTNASGYSDVFDVYDATPNYLLSLADAKDVLRLTDSANDERIRSLNAATTYVIERHLNEIVAPRTFVDDYVSVKPGRWGNSLSLRNTPVLSISSIVSEAALFTWNTSDFHLDSLTGELTSLPSTWGLFGNITITYVAGYSVIPENYLEAAKLIIQHMWTTRRGLTGIPRLGTVGEDGVTITRLGLGYSIPNAALELLGDRMSGFA